MIQVRKKCLISMKIGIKMPKKLTTEIFIQKSKGIHGNKFDYSMVEYINNKTKVKLICNSCMNKIEQRPLNNLQGSGCYICDGIKKLDNKIFIEKSKKIHGDK